MHQRLPSSKDEISSTPSFDARLRSILRFSVFFLLLGGIWFSLTHRHWNGKDFTWDPVTVKSHVYFFSSVQLHSLAAECESFVKKNEVMLSSSGTVMAVNKEEPDETATGWPAACPVSLALAAVTRNGEFSYRVQGDSVPAGVAVTDMVDEVTFGRTALRVRSGARRLLPVDADRPFAVVAVEVADNGTEWQSMRLVDVLVNMYPVGNTTTIRMSDGRHAVQPAVAPVRPGSLLYLMVFDQGRLVDIPSVTAVDTKTYAAPDRFSAVPSVQTACSLFDAPVAVMYLEVNKE
jgi:hypothetical protein